jgi:hypothetical protein
VRASSGSSHSAWSTIPAAVGAAVGFLGSHAQGLPWGFGLFVAVATAVIGLLLGRLALAVTLWLWAIPARRRERDVRAVQGALRELDVRELMTPIVQRLRYLGGHGDHPDDESFQPWRGFDAELADVEVRVLEPTRAVLRRVDQRQLCDQVAIDGCKLDPTELSVELDRLMGRVESWQNGHPEEVPFRL